MFHQVLKHVFYEPNIPERSFFTLPSALTPNTRKSKDSARLKIAEYYRPIPQTDGNYTTDSSRPSSSTPSSDPSPENVKPVVPFTNRLSSTDNNFLLGTAENGSTESLAWDDDGDLLIPDFVFAEPDLDTYFLYPTLN